MRFGRSTDGERWEFVAPVVRFGPGGRWTGVRVPFHVPAVWGTRTRVAVRGTLEGVELAGWVVPSGDGAFFLLVGRELRRATGVSAGREVRVILERRGPVAVTPPAGRPF